MLARRQLLPSRSVPPPSIQSCTQTQRSFVRGTSIEPRGSLNSYMNKVVHRGLSQPIISRPMRLNLDDLKAHVRVQIHVEAPHTAAGHGHVLPRLLLY
jgi:hypothetical protein